MTEINHPTGESKQLNARKAGDSTIIILAVRFLGPKICASGDTLVLMVATIGEENKA